MAVQRHYPKAPITEAIIDLRVELTDGVTVGDLESVHVGQESAYPTKRNITRAVLQGQIGDQGAAAAASSKPIGFLFTSQDEKQVFQVRLDGFTMSRLAPYERWEPFRDEAHRLWDVYRSVANPKKVVRLAVRYVNRLNLPLPFGDFKEYLKTVPEVSPELPQGLAGFFMQLAIPQEDIKSVALLNEAIIEPTVPNTVSVVLDIDVFRTDDLPYGEDGVWAFFETLRDRKNEVFEACITDRARELFE